MKLDLSKWTKVSGDQHKSTFENAQQHSLTIQHKHLSPKWKAQIIAMPSKGVATPEKAEAAQTFQKGKSQQPNKVAALAEGGKVSGQGVVETRNKDHQVDDGSGDAVDKASKAAANLKENFKYDLKVPYMADGGEVEQPQQQAAPAPVTINIGQPSNQMSALPTGQLSPEQMGMAAPAIQPQPIPAPQQAAPAPQQPIQAPSPVQAKPPTAKDPNEIDYSKADYSGETPYGLPVQSAQPQAAPVSQGPQGPASMPAPKGPDDITRFIGAQAGGYNLQEKGIEQKAAAEAQVGQEQANILQRMASNDLRMAEDEKLAQSAAQQSYENFVHDVQNAHIKPNQYMENMSVPQKVSTALGILLGGFQAGLGRGNPAMEYLQSQMNRDMQAQEKNLAASENLLHHNLMQTKNMQDARALTRAMINAGYMHQIDMAAAKNRAPQAQAVASQLKGQLMQQNAQWLSQVGATSGTISKDPAMAIRILIPQHEQHAAIQELKEAQLITKEHNNLLKAIDEVAKLQTLGNRIMNPIQSKRQIAAIVGPTVAALSKATAGRFTEQDSKMLMGLMPDLWSNKATVGSIKEQASRRVLEKAAAPTLEKYRINPFLNIRSPMGQVNNGAVSGGAASGGQQFSFKPAQ